MPDASPGTAEAIPDVETPALGGRAPLATDAAAARERVIGRLVGDGGEALVRKVGRFTLLERVGQGGMGVVYAAYDPDLNRRVALKLLRTELADDALRRRVVREAQAMARLAHPNVASVFEVGEHEGRTFIALEFIDGETLRAWQRRGDRPWQERVAMYLQAARGLAAAHAAGLVHRDFKPDNALVGGDGRLRVVDFGLARVEHSATETLEDAAASEPPRSPDDALATPLTRTGAMMGTPAYMAPEQLLGEPADPRTDQFGFCVALWEALFGTRPFAGGSASELVANVTRGRLSAPPRDTRVPSWIRIALERGLSVAAADRFATMDALLAALQNDPTRGRRVRLAAAATVLAVGVGLGGWALMRQQRLAACDTAATATAGLWDDAARERTRAAIDATGVGYAASSWAHVEPKLTEHVAGLVDAQVEQCRARVRGDGSDEAEANERASCLEQRHAVVRGLIDGFGSVTAADVEGVAPAVHRLEPPASCLTPEQRRASAAAEPTAAPEVREALSRAEAARLLGQAARGVALLSPWVDATAEQPATHVRVLSLLAELEDGAGNPPAARRRFEEALRLAMRHGFDNALLDAAIGLGNVRDGAAPAESTRALWWSEVALERASGLGAAASLRATKLRLSVARLRSAQDGVSEEQLEAARAVLQAAEVTYGEDHPAVITALGAVAEAESAIGRPSAALELFRLAARRASEQLGDDHPRLLMLGLAIAGELLELEQLEEARAALVELLERSERALGPNHLDVAAVLYAKARAARRLGRYDEGQQALERARQIVRSISGPDTQASWNLEAALANLATERGDAAGAAARFDALIADQRRVGAPATTIGSASINAGNAYRALAQHDEAEARYAEALALFTEHFGPDHLEVAFVLHDSTYTFADRGLWEEVESRERRAIAIVEGELGPDHTRLGDSLIQLGLAAHGQGRPAEAVEHLARGLAINERSDDGRPGQLAWQQYALARAQLESGHDRAEALALGRRARERAASVGATVNEREIAAWLRTVEAEPADPRPAAR